LSEYVDDITFPNLNMEFIEYQIAYCPTCKVLLGYQDGNNPWQWIDKYHVCADKDRVSVETTSYQSQAHELERHKPS